MCTCGVYEGLEYKEGEENFTGKSVVLMDTEVDLFNCNFQSLFQFKYYNAEFNFLFALPLWVQSFQKRKM